MIRRSLRRATPTHLALKPLELEFGVVAAIPNRYQILITTLNEGWIAGAGLDTVATEPLPPESPLWSLPNAFITPHCSALSPRLRERIAQLFIDNLKRYQTGQPLWNVVDKQAGY